MDAGRGDEEQEPEEEEEAQAEEESDDDINADDIKGSLDRLLSSVESFGSFATCGRVAGDVVTGLSVHDVGRIALPLGHGQAKDIIAVCHRAPFGKGSETIVDESVRKTWELDPSQFSLSGPTWPAVLDDVINKVGRELGCGSETTIRASLYKSLLYETGALFKPHEDTEKEPGMFGTLVICLPSEYTGGAVVASHCGQSRVLQADSPTFFHSYISWYWHVDVHH